jgi:hypothetical protein
MRLCLILGLVILTGCVAARDPQLLAVERSGDGGLSCEQIATEYKGNTEAAYNKIAKNRSDDRRELLLALFVWPGFIDIKNADGKEGNALLDRNIYLLGVAKAKSCTAVNAWPEQPKRYTQNEGLPNKA